MLGRKIRLYRLQQGLTKKELAVRTGISQARITAFENGRETPNTKIARVLASALGVSFPQLMKFVPSSREYQHGEFRKQSSLSKSAQTYLRMLSEEYFDRLFLAADLLGGKVLREPPTVHCLIISGSPEADAMLLRSHLGVAIDGPVPALIDMLENKGILICKIPYEHTNFSGINGMADKYPYIAINSKATPERQRSTIIHELAHIFFELPKRTALEHEKYVEAVCGAFLFPSTDAYIELGRKRKAISSDMVIVAKEYGISLQLLAKRAEQLGIISADTYRNFNIAINKSSARFSEGGRIKPEEPKLLEQLVLRGWCEDKMSLSRAAELLDITYSEMRDKAELWN